MVSFFKVSGRIWTRNTMATFETFIIYTSKPLCHTSGIKLDFDSFIIVMITLLLLHHFYKASINNPTSAQFYLFINVVRKVTSKCFWLICVINFGMCSVLPALKSSIQIILNTEVGSVIIVFPFQQELMNNTLSVTWSPDIGTCASFTPADPFPLSSRESGLWLWQV